MPFSPIDAAGGLTYARLREALHYEPTTGAFTWLIPGCGPGGGGVRGVSKPAGGISAAGYVRISIDGVRYRAHRLAWFYMTGAWPSEQVDHKNGRRADNRWENLREASQRQNSANMMRTNKSGVKGVVRYRGSTREMFRANIMVNNRTIYLGSFPTIEEAAQAYRNAAEKYFGEFARAA